MILAKNYTFLKDPISCYSLNKNFVDIWSLTRYYKNYLLVSPIILVIKNKDHLSKSCSTDQDSKGQGFELK